MSDPRFARLKSDPRFRPIHKKESKIVVDDRFKSVFQNHKPKPSQGRVDKYGRPLATTHEQDNLRRFYRLEAQEAVSLNPKAPDYARGEVLLESSDEEDQNSSDADSEVVALGYHISKPIPVLEQEAEIDLSESQLADLDAQAASFADLHSPGGEASNQGVEPTKRLAVVNLDWDHVHAAHLFKIFSSLLSPTANPAPFPPSKDAKSRIARGEILSVRVYPSKFGKERMAREEVEGPPPGIFRRGDVQNEEDINAITIYEAGDGQDYNEDALRKYQLERLRYYYAIVECDTAAAASHIYSELDGTELERTANALDLSFVPDEMTFDDEPRDDARDDLPTFYKPLDFVTDALRHSRVKLTWDDDDPERVQMTRRTLSRKEIEENDFRAYIASSESESEDRDTSRDKLRSLLLGGVDGDLPEGWGERDRTKGGMDMEITFTPGLSRMGDAGDETTLEKYKRKVREKKKKRREGSAELMESGAKEGDGFRGDDFFATNPIDDEAARDQGYAQERKKEDELALIVSPDNLEQEPRHFNMKAIIKEEKLKGKKRKLRKGKAVGSEEQEIQDEFEIDVGDDRFKALHEDHTFAIDPSNPHFKKTKSMSALLEERSKRQRPQQKRDIAAPTSRMDRDLKTLVESVKRKSSTALDLSYMGKRQRL